MPLTVLHTSDWHLGHMLYRKKRDAEFEAFLDWLLELIIAQKVDVLIVTGDIFDTAMPSNTAQALYYNFMSRLKHTCCRHVVIIAGNHDSASFLDAPRQLLRFYNIHITGMIGPNIGKEILVLRDAGGKPELIVAAVPYLRERDVREFKPGQTQEERGEALIRGMREHYASIAQECEKYKQAYPGIPVIATGHLYAAGIETAEESSERDLYIGSIYRAPTDIFPAVFDYVALGHIHKSMMVGGQENIRYSGAPLPLSFAETRYEKSVILLQLGASCMHISEIGVPHFRDMRIIKGSMAEICEELEQLKRDNGRDKEIWLEIQHDGTDSAANLKDVAQRMIEGTGLEILCIKSGPQKAGVAADVAERSLEEYVPEDIFKICLESGDQKKLDQAQREELLHTFRELYCLYLEGRRGE